MDLNAAFKTTCKILFGEELGELSEFDAYLREAAVGKSAKSCFSGKDLRVTYDYYCEKAKFFDYSNEYGKISALNKKALSINEIKDIDSLFGAVKEKFVYSGNKVLGNSHFITDSDNVSDSSYVHASSVVIQSKYIAYSYLERNSEYAFASTSSGDSSYILRCFYNNSIRRCFECCYVVPASDCYFCYNLQGSTDCMFTFNLRNKSRMIGNVQLEREQYSELKKKLVAEMADGLKRKKRLDYSVIDLFTGVGGG